MENNKKKTDTSKKSSASKGNSSARSASSGRQKPTTGNKNNGTPRGTAAGQTQGREQSAKVKTNLKSTKGSVRNTKKQKKKKKGGISFSTFLLILLTAAVLLVCGYLVYKELTKEEQPDEPTAQTSPAPSDGTLTDTAPAGTEESGEESESKPQESTEEPQITPSYSTQTPTEQSQTPTEHSQTQPQQKDPIETIWFPAPAEEDFQTRTFGNDSTYCTITYYVPKPEMQAEDQVRSRIEEEIERTLRRIFDKIGGSYRPDTHDMSEYTLHYEFRYSSKNTLSILFFYPVFSGYGDVFENVISLNVNARTGNVLDLTEDIADEPLLSECARSRLTALEIFTETNVLNCSGWYIDNNGSELVLLYNPRFFDRNNEILRITVTDGFTEK